MFPPPPQPAARPPGSPLGKRSGVTTAAGVLATVLAGLWVLFGVLLLAIAALVNSLRDEFDDEGAASLALGGLLIIAVALWCIVAAINLLLRRRWARIATIINFSILAAGSVLSTASWLGIRGGSIGSFLYLGSCVTVVVLAAQRSVGNDITAHERGRLRGPGGDFPSSVPPPGIGAPPASYPQPPQ